MPLLLAEGMFLELEGTFFLLCSGTRHFRRFHKVRLGFPNLTVGFQI